MLDEIIITFENCHFKKLEVKQSGSQRPNVKVVPSSTVQALNSVRAAELHPQKGTQNPPHFHIKLPKWFTR